MRIDEIIDWMRNNPKKASEDFMRMCESGDFHFSLADRCSQCPYDGVKGCNLKQMAEDIESYL